MSLASVLVSANNMPAPTPILVPNPSTTILRDLAVLHPTVRDAVTRTVADLNAEGFPFKVFEAYRMPQRQAYLFGQGRTRPGAIVTQARPWESYHQFGLAADIVLCPGGKWSWDASAEYIQAWDRLHDIGRSYDLEPLNFERPHLQLANFHLSDLKAGKLPGGGDAAWWEAFKTVVDEWSGIPLAPVL